jgi:hypothetical protein
VDYKSLVRHGVRWRKSLTPNRLTLGWLERVEVHGTSTLKRLAALRMTCHEREQRVIHRLSVKSTREDRERDLET